MSGYMNDDLLDPTLTNFADEEGEDGDWDGEEDEEGDDVEEDGEGEE
jgi:hypothetical protein